MVFTVGSKPDDTNNNGFPDSIKASVALFSTHHPTAMRQDGTFEFLLYSQGKSGSTDSKPTRTWRIEGAELERCHAHTLAGPSYIFNLSLLANGTDRLALERADLACVFWPADGSAAVRSDGVRSIQVGRRMTAELTQQP